MIRPESVDGAQRVRGRFEFLSPKSCLQIPWHVDDVDTPIPSQKQHCGQHFATLIVQEIMVPVALDHGGDRYRDSALAILLFDLQHIVHHRL